MKNMPWVYVGREVITVSNAFHYKDCQYYKSYEDGPGWCCLIDHPCLVDEGLECEEWTDFLKELAEEEA